MKRAISLILALLLCLTLCACGGEQTAGTQQTGSTQDTTQATESTSTTQSTENTESTAPVEVHTHSYTEEVTAPTCTEQGYTTYFCDCGDSYVDNYTEPGHHYLDGYCSVCGEKEPEPEAVDSGTCGANLTWILYENGLLRISGTGEMESYHPDWIPTPWRFDTGIKTVVIEEGVTSIGNYAFFDTSLISITIPATLTRIGEFAFSNCAVWVDADNAYYSSDDYGVFFNKGRTELIIAPSAISGAYEIPDSVTSIGEYAFAYCRSLTSITIPDSVTSIGEYAFRGCTSLTSITIPDSVTSIGDRAFYYCTSLTGIWVDENNAYYSSDDYGVLFNKDKTTLIQAPGAIATYTIPDSVTSIGYEAFSVCTILESITIPDSVTSIGDCAFRGCTSLTSVTIGDSVNVIGNYAFQRCSGLIGITIPANVAQVGYLAFQGCDSLKEIFFEGDAPIVVDHRIMFDMEETATAYYPVDNDTWTEAVRQSYGGNIIWVAYKNEQ